MKDQTDNDVFISYAHLDNEPLFKDQEGWVSSFQFSLNARLGQLLGRKPRIWRDIILQGNDRLSDEIVEKLRNTKVLLAVISPGYLQSRWCMKELREYIKAVEAGSGLYIGNKSRIFKVVKTFVYHEAHPDELRDLLGYEFFLKDDRGRPHECTPEREAVYYQKYLKELENVAYDICELIREIERENLKTANEAPQPSPEEPGKENKERESISVSGVRKPPVEYSFEDLDRELIARGAQVPEKKRFKFKDKEGTPQRDEVVEQLKELYGSGSIPIPDLALSHISTGELVKILMFKAGKIGFGGSRGIWIGDDRMDFYDIIDEQVKESANCTAAVFLENSFVEKAGGYAMLRVKNYGKAFNLVDSEPFHHQPVAAMSMCTGFLVKEDVVATAAHFADRNNVTSLRFMFGYKMEEPYARIDKFFNQSIYKGVEIIGRKLIHDGKKSDWALVRLDRPVEGQTIAKLSKREIFSDQSIYVMGHPCGLPLKFAPGAKVRNVEETYFSAYLDIYSGNSGSPVFDSETHEVIGMVVRGDNRDFRWTGSGFMSVLYPNPEIHSEGPECTRVSEFIDIVEKL